MGVQHFLRETLHAMETQRSWDEDLALLLQMWAKEKDKLKRSNSAVSILPWAIGTLQICYIALLVAVAYAGLNTTSDFRPEFPITYARGSIAAA